MTGEGRTRRTDPRRGSAAARPVGLEHEITLRAMRFHALIGILEHERSVPQPLEVDLTVRCDAAAGVVDYRRLYEMVERIVSAGPTDYLETIADRVARKVLEDGRAWHARVAVRKPHVALPGPLAYAEVVVRHGREEAR
jgi:7,8-dihydroneopterin aldolase/epimerase/oxygenase